MRRDGGARQYRGALGSQGSTGGGADAQPNGSELRREARWHVSRETTSAQGSLEDSTRREPDLQHAARGIRRPRHHSRHAALGNRRLEHYKRMYLCAVCVFMQIFPISAPVTRCSLPCFVPSRARNRSHPASQPSARHGTGSAFNIST